MRRLGLLSILMVAAAFGLALASARLAVAQKQEPAPKSYWEVAPPKSKGEPRGYVQYQEYCTVCHGSGVGKPGTLALQAKYKGAKPALLEDRTDLTVQLIKTYVRNGISVMPFFRKTEISGADLDAIAAYLTRNNKRDAR
jgi:mono/diheme cytochrome c family protein